MEFYKMKRKIYADYLKGLLNEYAFLKELHKKSMKSLCYYIEKNNIKMIRERNIELKDIKDKLNNLEEGIIDIYGKLNGEKIITNNRTFGRKEINIIRKFLNL